MFNVSVPGRPQRSLVVVNPKAGGCKAAAQYKSLVAPLFQIANISTTVHSM